MKGYNYDLTVETVMMDETGFSACVKYPLEKGIQYTGVQDPLSFEVGMRMIGNSYGDLDTAKIEQVGSCFRSLLHANEDE